jgi:hypothetical protein
MLPCRRAKTSRRFRPDVRLLFLLVVLLAGLRPAAARKAKPAPLSDAKIEALFDAKQSDIRTCALEQAIYKGAKSVELKAKILIGRDGRVFGATVSAKVEGGDGGAAVEKCVAEVIRTIVFPSGSSAFRELLRSWRFAVA